MSDQVQDEVVRLAIAGEVVAPVVDHLIGTKRPHELELSSVVDPGDVRTKAFGQLDREGPRAPAPAVDETRRPFAVPRVPCRAIAPACGIADAWKVVAAPPIERRGVRWRRNDARVDGGRSGRWSGASPDPVGRSVEPLSSFPASTATGLSLPAPTGAATGASRDLSCSTTALPCMPRSSGWSSGANTYRAFARMLASSTEESEVRDPSGHSDEKPAGNGGVHDAERTARLA
jgi:hypothetical protein